MSSSTTATRCWKFAALTEDLTVLPKAIRNGDGDLLFDVFTRTRAIRHSVIEAGQSVPPAPPKG